MIKLPLNNIKNIAILCRPQIGDFILTIPLLKYCRALLPQAKITLFGWPVQQALLPYFQDYDEFVTLNYRLSKISSLLTTALRYRSQHFDLVMHAKETPSATGNLFLAILNARYRAAYTNKHWSTKLINEGLHCNSIDKINTHFSLKMLKLGGFELNATPLQCYPRFKIPAEKVTQWSPSVAAMLKPIQTAKGPAILVSVTNNREFCFLGIERYASLLNTVYKQFSFRVVISGLAKDAANAKKLAALLHMPHAIAITPTLDQFFILLNRIDGCFIGEGGTMHMAAAFNIPQLVLFGRTLLTEWAPLSSKAQCLHHPVDIKQIPDATLLPTLLNFIKQLTCQEKSISYDSATSEHQQRELVT